MADVTVTAANVTPANNLLVTSVGTAGATITQGQPLYMDPSTLGLKPCAATALASSTCVGIALNAASTGQPVQYAVNGQISFGVSTLTKGTVYVVSANSGKIAPVADLVSTNYVTVLGIATSSAILQLLLNVSGIAI